MKSLLILTLLISFPTFYASQDGRLRSSKSDDKTVQGAIQIDEEFSKAVLNDDVDIFKRLIADDFTGISYSGQLLNKDKWVEGSKSSLSRYVSYTPHDVSAR